jgi:uncharacterized protein YbaR (Trm112 family)
MEFGLSDDHFTMPSNNNASANTGPISCIVEECDATSSFTCPSCKQHYCNRHAGSTLMIAKMSRNDDFDPNYGEYKRICIYCYWESRPGYGTKDLDILPSADHRDYFYQTRSRSVDKLELSMARIEKRLEKLAEYCQFSEGVGRVTFDEHCQRLIPWDTDDSSSECTVCRMPFNVLKRRHHCRLCGSLICDSCSRHIPVRTMHAAMRKSHVIMTRSCIMCYSLLFKY